MKQHTKKKYPFDKRASAGGLWTPASLSLHVCEIHKRAQYSVAIIQPWWIQKSSVDEIEKRELPSHHVSSHRSIEQLLLDMMGSANLSIGRDVSRWEGQTSHGIIANLTWLWHSPGWPNGNGLPWLLLHGAPGLAVNPRIWAMITPQSRLKNRPVKVRFVTTHTITFCSYHNQ